MTILPKPPQRLMKNQTVIYYTDLRQKLICYGLLEEYAQSVNNEQLDLLRNVVEEAIEENRGNKEKVIESLKITLNPYCKFLLEPSPTLQNEVSRAPMLTLLKKDPKLTTDDCSFGHS